MRGEGKGWVAATSQGPACLLIDPSGDLESVAVAGVGHSLGWCLDRVLCPSLPEVSSKLGGWPTCTWWSWSADARTW